ncbi:hypothetical protein SISSUDRAFT_1040268 [Sistotremastrum suecicum HHB10207 ss-3]|uniref:Uncharacterized protein n=1 Tax=Sistotremastrum suecicum HHB10207 ss-3 TaxID=1314776 RepID=A0A166I1R1_9AGAM|nr:hypothetical protein SISSUDRAFT_1040268 [Sistotremastrum suecicum HHB10207 ss-3]
MLWDTAPQHVHQHGLIRFPNPNSTPANVLPSDKRTTSSQHSLVFQPSQPSPSLSAEGTGQIVGHHTGSSSGTETAAYDDNVAPLFTNSSSLQRSGPGTVTFTKDTMQGDDSMSNTDIHSRKRHLPDLRSDDPVDGQKRYRTGPGSSYNTVQSPMPITPYTFSPAFLDSISHNSTRPSSSNSTPTGAQASDSSTGLTQVGLRAESTDIHERLSTIVESPEASKPLDLKVLTNETESPNVSDHPAEKSLQPEEHNEHYVLEAQVPQTVPPTSSLHLKNPTGKANSDAHQLQQSANITSKVSRLPIASTRKTSTGHLTPRVRSPEMRPNSPPVRNMKSPVTSPSAASRMRSPSPGLPPWNPGPY